MANGVVIPPWLNIDPVAPVGRYLEGYGLGQRAGAAQTEALARAQQMAMAQQQAAELNAYRQQQQALAERKFTEDLRFAQQKAQREAQEAAIQLEGMQMLDKRTAAGEPFEKVWPDVATKILYRHPQSLAQSMKGLGPPRPPVFTKGPGGIDIMQGPSGAPRVLTGAGTPLGQEAYTARQILDESGRPTGMSAIPGRGAARVLTQARTNLSPEGRIRALTLLATLENNKSQYGKTKEEREAAAKKRDDYAKQIEDLTKSIAAPEGVVPRLPGKEDELVGADELATEEEDFLLPPVSGEEESQGEEEF